MSNAVNHDCIGHFLSKIVNVFYKNSYSSYLDTMDMDFGSGHPLFSTALFILLTTPTKTRIVTSNLIAIHDTDWHR